MADDEFERELNRLRPTLLRFAVLQLRDEQAAEDAVQDTLLAALQGRERFAGRAQVKTWVVSILKNKIVDRIRQRCREAPLAEVGGNEAEEFDALFATDGHWREVPADWGDPAKSFEQGRFFDVLELCLQ